MRQSYLYNGNPKTAKVTSSHWDDTAEPWFTNMVRSRTNKYQTSFQSYIASHVHRQNESQETLEELFSTCMSTLCLLMT